MGQNNTNLNNLFCQTCKHKNCICDADQELQQVFDDIKDSPAKQIIGRSLELMSEMRKIANQQGYFVRKEPANVN